MRQTIASVLVAFGCFYHATAQSTSVDPSSLCIPNSGITALPNCDYIGEFSSTCNSSLPKSDQIKCDCTQQVFNAFVECGNEMRLCFGNDDYDNVIEDAVSDWHTGCDEYMAASVTTPVISTITSAVDNVAACTSMLSACATLSAEVEKCEAGIAASASACICAPKVISAEYNCEFVGNVSCVQTSGVLSEMVAYSFCSNFQSVIGGAINATAIVTSASTHFQTTSLSDSITVARPTPTTTSATATSSSAVYSIHNNIFIFGAFYLSFTAFIALVL